MNEHTVSGSEKVQALLLAMDALAADLGSAGSSDWGVSGLGSETVQLDEFVRLARLNHRVSALLGQWIVQGAVAGPPASGPSRSGPLVNYESAGPSSPATRPTIPTVSPVDSAAVSSADGSEASSNGPAEASWNGSAEASSISAAAATSISTAAATSISAAAAAAVDAAAATDFSGTNLPFGAQATLKASAWSPRQSQTLVAAARFAARFPNLNRLWSRGEISADMIREMARASRILTAEQVDEFVAIMVDHLPGLDYQQVRRLAGRVIDLVRPDGLDKDEERKHAKRSLTFSHYLDTVIFHGRLPKLEGQLFSDAITAMAEKQRSEGDGLSVAQRNADALTEIIAHAASHGSMPTLGGLPVAVTLTMTDSVAEAVAKAAGYGTGFESDAGVNVRPCADPGAPGAAGSAAGGAGGAGGAGDAGDAGGPLQDATPSHEASPGRATYPDGALVASAVVRFALCAGQITPVTIEDPSTQSPTDTTSTNGSGSGSGNGLGNGLGSGSGNGLGKGSVNGSSAATGNETGETTHGDKGTTTDNGNGPRTGRSLGARLLDSHPIPLSVGRAQRLATSAQRKALALRDGGCVIPGCSIAPNRTQPHHVLDFSLGGPTDLENLASLCWTHHRQVDLGHWTLTRSSDFPTDTRTDTNTNTDTDTDTSPPSYWTARPDHIRKSARPR